MSKDDSSDSESNKKNDSDSSSEEVETPVKVGTPKIAEYEKQRMKRMEDNRARMEALGLHKMASSLMGSAQKKKKSEPKPKGKRKVVEEDDEEYRPPEREQALSYSSEGDDDDDDDDSSGSRTKKAKKKISTPNKKVPIQKLSSNKDFIDDDDALMQAIALSLQDSAGFLDVGNSVPSQSPDAHVIDGNANGRKGNADISEDTGKRKRKKSMSSRVQMTEDELILHFFQFDGEKYFTPNQRGHKRLLGIDEVDWCFAESGKGSITLRDLRRIAAAHDFPWSDMEMADMIYFFDSDGDGKLSLDNFRNIVGRCNMIQESENAAMGSKAR